MARPSEAKALIEAERLHLLHQEQARLRKRIQKETKVKKKSMPGEELLHKNIAVLLKVGVPGITHGDIADRLGIPRKIVREWFKNDPEVREQYEWIIANLTEGALSLIKTYSLEAVETLALLMRFGSEKYMFESAKEILDRVGVPKVQRTEIEREDIKSHKWSDRDQLVDDIRQLPPELQEEALKSLEKFEELLTKESNTTNGKVDDESADQLEPIIRSGEDDEDEDEDDE